MDLELGDGTLKEMLAEAFTSGDMELPSSMINLIFTLIEIIIGIVAYFVAFIALRLVSWILLYPILKIFVKKGAKKRKAWGALIGMLQGVLVAFFICSPITGLLAQVGKLSTLEMDGKKLALFAVLFVVCLLTVFHVIHYGIMTVIVLAAIAVIDRKLLKKLDVALLATFVCFFIVSGNLGRVDAVRDFLQGLLEKNTLLTTIGTSQIISNVPAAVLLSGFTGNWQDLLAGVNIGGLGTPIASLASLITLKLYLRHPGANAGKFLAVFTVANVIGLVVLLIFSIVL